ncbi:hypothetical protein M441DRAFT_64505 [Trichoderma asperellum CBS 433.97]|uniref:Uncharacterized protein n=1 Tax=Trichoderma asperellum (strain ATCC 204424 / CBS 433.97 / NBRC 101777) TaxID=1042311 RepID=A0A2T3ZJ38_TRIA4|nr:hypothetical protein M441DRAFT_64505 [Trichoderma asperellum CBS 433.97]PTB44824.1 hypothetical protein M441DRAFT_64505 [Trichoderma asperellum CBS 433.97]
MSLDSHCVYRSEELYRTWQLSQVWALSRDGILRPNDLKQVKLYQLYEFSMLLDVSATACRNAAGVAAKADYRSWWHHYYRLAGFRDASWLNRGVRNRLFRILQRGTKHSENKSNQSLR